MNNEGYGMDTERSELIRKKNLKLGVKILLKSVFLILVNF